MTLTHPSNLGPVVEALCGRVAQGGGRRRLLPSHDVLITMVDDLRAVLFPGYFTDWDLSDESLHYYIGATVDRVLHTLQEQVLRALHEADQDDQADERALSITSDFLSRLPRLRKTLAADVQAHFDGDPAATSLAEVIFSYPGLRAITDYRLAHELYALDVPLIPRIITEHAHSRTGIDIHPGARIADGFFIDHGTGVVIGETCRIGSGVRIYQGVTLGAKSFPLDKDGNPVKGVDRHPIVKDRVIIYSGATILGRVTLGEGATIGGNVWLTHSVPPGAVVTQGQSRQIGFEHGGGI